MTSPVPQSHLINGNPHLNRGEDGLTFQSFCSSAPDFRLIYPGLNIEIDCPHTDCRVNREKRYAWIQPSPNQYLNSVRKVDDVALFNFSSLIFSAKCPSCSKPLYNGKLRFKNLGFFKCTFNVKFGLQDSLDNRKLCDNDQVANRLDGLVKLHKSTVPDNINYAFIEIEIKLNN